ncbi:MULTISPECIES: hypothetical protein [unclassified Erythrobacter]|uniref:hypothetical protein n=1 Tax=unclassified Erythrobacter TaxID=2633097 RepID=UPI00076C4351|nr:MULTISPECIES: hypothetical protein [unclassified Erythrobacter]KWV93932.1 hypothetical protein ASS64_13670 [Erythrobacter sp. AP23]MBO6767409.1 hypothetical protein [Erythrobacter sp.]
MPIAEQFKSTEMAIGAGVAFFAEMAKYYAISNVVDLPESLTGLPPFLSTLSVIVFGLLLVYLSDRVLQTKPAILVVIVIAMLTGGTYLSSRFASEVKRHSIAVECVDYPRSLILEPEEPSAQLSRLLDDGGGLDLAWCAENKVEVRSMIKKQNANRAHGLTIMLIVAETLLALALTLAGWLVANRRQ